MRAPAGRVTPRGPRSLGAVRLLRLSLTDRCNLRCVYCMPKGGVPFSDRADLLGAADILAVARAARRVGVDHFKITGGEINILPALRPPGDPTSCLIQLMRDCVVQKPDVHSARGNRAMSQLGG